MASTTRTIGESVDSDGMRGESPLLGRRGQWFAALDDVRANQGRLHGPRVARYDDEWNGVLHAGLAISSACSRDRSIPCTLFAWSCAFWTTSSSFLPRNTNPHGQLITFSIGVLLRCDR